MRVWLTCSSTQKVIWKRCAGRYGACKQRRPLIIAHIKRTLYPITSPEQTPVWNIWVKRRLCKIWISARVMNSWELWEKRESRKRHDDERKRRMNCFGKNFTSANEHPNASQSSSCPACIFFFFFFLRQRFWALQSLADWFSGKERDENVTITGFKATGYSSVYPIVISTTCVARVTRVSDSAKEELYRSGRVCPRDKGLFSLAVSSDSGVRKRIAL